MPHTSQVEIAQQRFLTLLDAHRGIVGKVAFTFCRDAEDRRDLEQEIVSQLWRAFTRYDPTRPFVTWAYRIALNVAISFVRDTTRRLRVTPLDGHSIPAELTAEPDDRLSVLRQLMDQLDHLSRALIVLYLDGRSYRDIANVLGISETNVATKLHRLKQWLRARATHTT